MTRTRRRNKVRAEAKATRRRGQCFWCGEFAHGVANCTKWKTYASEQDEESECREETVQVTSAVESALMDTGQFAALHEGGAEVLEDPSGLTGVHKPKTIKRLEVTVHSGAKESVWPAKWLLQGKNAQERSSWSRLARKWAIAARRRSWRIRQDQDDAF